MLTVLADKAQDIQAVSTQDGFVKRWVEDLSTKRRSHNQKPNEGSLERTFQLSPQISEAALAAISHGPGVASAAGGEGCPMCAFRSKGLFHVNVGFQK